MKMKFNLYCRFLVLFSSLSFLIFTGCSYLKTQFVTSVNHYQNGNTIGKGNIQSGFAMGAGRLTETDLAINLTETNSGYVSNYLLHSEVNRTITINSFLQYGVSNRVDVLAEGYLSFFGAGIRSNLKYKVNNHDANFCIALMPGIGFTYGTKDDKASKSISIELPFGTIPSYSNSYKLSSKALSLELNIPMSYRFSDDFEICFGLYSTKIIHYVSSHFSVDNSFDYISESKNFNFDYFYPGCTFGFRHKQIHPEVSIDYVDGKFIPYFGVGVKEPKYKHKD